MYFSEISMGDLVKVDQLISGLKHSGTVIFGIRDNGNCIISDGYRAYDIRISDYCTKKIAGIIGRMPRIGQCIKRTNGRAPEFIDIHIFDKYFPDQTNQGGFSFDDVLCDIERISPMMIDGEQTVCVECGSEKAVILPKSFSLGTMSNI